MSFSALVVAITACLASSGVSAFTTPVHPRTKSSALYGIRCENKYYQLEEMEDKENCTTELFLTQDGRIEFGETDGPVWSDAEGYWQVEPGTDNFRMSIVRKFNSGNKNTDMGEFSYDIARYYAGEMTKVGDSVGITGVIHSQAGDFTFGTGGVPDQEIGYFNMIDGTDVREDRRPDARSGVQQSS